MKKVLFVATVTRHIIAFHLPYLKWFKEHGYEVHVASNGDEHIDYCDKHFNINFARFPLKTNNIKAYKELKKIIKENKYEIIHCHTPVGGVLTRLAARKSRKENNTKVIYTAHGFHFYKGAPILNWIIYYLIEKIMAHYTDCLITINNEDYERAKKNIKAKKVKLVHGVGMNADRFDKKITEEEKENFREKFKIRKEDIVFSYIAELNNNKNQILLLDVLKELKEKYSNVKLILVGNYPQNGYYEKEINRRNLVNEVILTGKNVEDVPIILSITDIYLASSIREGLPVNIMEAMYMGIPIVANNNRGHRELVKNEKNGYIINDKIEMKKRIEDILKDETMYENMRKENMLKIEKYLLKNVEKDMERIYREVLN